MASQLNENIQYIDPTTGELLVNGLVYIGANNLDAELNPITIYSDVGLTTALSNPQRIGADGRVSNKIFVPGKYSLLVKDSDNNQKLNDLSLGEAETVNNTPLINVQGVNDITAEASPSIVSLVDGQTYIFTTVNANTGAMTLEIDSITAYPIKKYHDQAIESGDFEDHQIVSVIWNSTDSVFELISNVSSLPDDIIKPYANIAALQAITAAPQITQATIKGYTTDGDGGGGSFYWDATSTETDNGGTIIKATAITTGRWKRIYSGAINVQWFGAKGDGTTVDTARIQAASDYLGVAGKLVYDGNKSYVQGSVTISSNVIVEGNNCTIIPDTNPAQCFLIASSSGNDRESIIIQNFINTGSVTDFIKFTGSYLWHNQVRNIDHRSGTSNSIVKTEIIAGVNPSGFRITNLNALHSGVKYGWHGTGSTTGASFDHVHIDHIEMWPSAGGWPIRVEHKISGNSWIDKLYHGAGSGVGGGVLHITQMEHGRIGQLWSEASNGDVSLLSGSYQNVDVDLLLAQTNIATESADTKLINAHMFNCEIKKCVLLDDNAAGYERDDTPPDNYKTFIFTNDSSAHISRDVRIGNVKGNFDHTHITNATGQGIRYIGKPGDDAIYVDHTEQNFTSATTGIGTANTVSIAEFSNWEWGIEGEGLEVIISGVVTGANAKDIRFGLDDVNVELGNVNLAAAGGFTLTAICQPHNDGTNRIRTQGSVLFNNAVTQSSTNAFNTWPKSDTRTSHIYIYAPTFNAADALDVHSVVVRQLRSTVR